MYSVMCTEDYTVSVRCTEDARPGQALLGSEAASPAESEAGDMVRV